MRETSRNFVFDQSASLLTFSATQSECTSIDYSVERYIMYYFTWSIENLGILIGLIVWKV